MLFLMTPFFQGFYQFFAKCVNLCVTYWLQLLILLFFAGLALWAFLDQSWKKDKQPASAGKRIFRGVVSFFVGLFRLFVQSPLLILFVLLLIFVRNPKLTRFFLRFLEGLGIPVHPKEPETEFEAEGKSNYQKEVEKSLREGKKLLIPPVAQVKEVPMKNLKEELRGKIALDYRKEPNTYVFQAIYVPDLGQSFSLPVWVRYQDILSVVKGKKGHEVVVYVRPQSRPSKAKKEWETLVARHERA